MFPLSSIVFIFLASLALDAPASESVNLVELGREPGAVPAESLIGELIGRFSEPEDEVEFRGGTPGLDDATIMNSVDLPLSSNLTPSAADAGIRFIDIPLTTPLCVIGPDPVSRRWLSRNRRHLYGMGATCILVEASSREQLDTVRKTAHPVPVQPLPFDRLAQAHGIRTVPVLLLGKGSSR